MFKKSLVLFAILAMAMFSMTLPAMAVTQNQIVGVTAVIPATLGVATIAPIVITTTPGAVTTGSSSIVITSSEAGTVSLGTIFKPNGITGTLTATVGGGATASFGVTGGTVPLVATLTTVAGQASGTFTGGSIEVIVTMP
jgi:hypothetical protein